jgi:hypothetical protein
MRLAFFHSLFKDSWPIRSKKINIAFSFAPFKEKPYFCVPFESKRERNKINDLIKTHYRD